MYVPHSTLYPPMLTLTLKQAAIENITYQMTTMKRQEANMKIGGAMALLKAQATTTFEYCAREASQIFGGLAYLNNITHSL